MPIDFPTSPTTGDVYTYLGKSWVYNGTGWDSPRALSEIGAVQTFENAAARTAAIPTPTEGIVSYLNDVDLLQTNNGSAWVTTGNAGVNAYNFVQTLYFTSSGTFTKADYPWLRAVKVKCQGGGGGGGNAAITDGTQGSAGSGGGGGAYAESFITNIAGLDSSITVTSGAGGASASNGNASSFGTAVSANGGVAGATRGASAASFGAAGGAGSDTGTGNIIHSGGSGGAAYGTGQLVNSGHGGDSFLGGGAAMPTAVVTSNQQRAGLGGRIYGGGGSGAINSSNSASATAGGAGANGVVILELYG
jgi:hypothetical protein